MGIVKRSLHVAIIVALACIAFDLVGCCGCKSETEARPNEAKRGGLWLQDARHAEGELTLLIKNIKVLRGDDLRKDNVSKGLARDLEPHLYVWASCAIDRLNQRDVAEYGYSIPPTREYWDWDNGNKIAFWDLTKEAQDGTTITLRRRIRHTAYETCYEVDPGSVEPYKRGSRLYKFYTKSEPLIEVTEEVRELARAIVGDEKNPYAKTRKIFEWILENLKYKYPPAERGAIHCLRAREGDCGEYSFLFCALCRAEGIPARFVGGMWFGAQTGFHAWAEFFVPPYGWIPADASHAQRGDGNHDYYYFGNLDNKRLIASVGTNLPIKFAPRWATYKVGDVQGGTTDFMQHSTVLMTGMKADISRRLRVTKTD